MLGIGTSVLEDQSDGGFIYCYPRKPASVVGNPSGVDQDYHGFAIRRTPPHMGVDQKQLHGTEIKTRPVGLAWEVVPAISSSCTDWAKCMMRDNRIKAERHQYYDVARTSAVPIELPTQRAAQELVPAPSISGTEQDIDNLAVRVKRDLQVKAEENHNRDVGNIPTGPGEPPTQRHTPGPWQRNVPTRAPQAMQPTMPNPGCWPTSNVPTAQRTGHVPSSFQNTFEAMTKALNKTNDQLAVVNRTRDRVAERLGEYRERHGEGDSTSSIGSPRSSPKVEWAGASRASPSSRLLAPPHLQWCPTSASTGRPSRAPGAPNLPEISESPGVHDPSERRPETGSIGGLNSPGLAEYPRLPLSPVEEEVDDEVEVDDEQESRTPSEQSTDASSASDATATGADDGDVSYSESSRSESSNSDSSETSEQRRDREFAEEYEAQTSTPTSWMLAGFNL